MIISWFFTSAKLYEAGFHGFTHIQKRPNYENNSRIFKKISIFFSFQLIAGGKKYAFFYKKTAPLWEIPEFFSRNLAI